MAETKLEGDLGRAPLPADPWYVRPSTLGHRYRRRWYLVAFCLVVGAVAGVAIGRTQSRVYSSTATLFLAATQGSFMTVDSVNAYAQLPQTTWVLERVARQSRVSASVPTLRDRLTVTVPFNTDLVKLTMDSGTANGAAELANAAAKQTAAYIAVVSRPSPSGTPLFLQGTSVPQPHLRRRLDQTIRLTWVSGC